MGDWLETGTAFGGDVRGVLKQIRAKGFEPAIWVAPFIAEAGSHLFQQHPDWFVKDARRQTAALESSDVRRLAARPLVCARRHPPGGAEAPRDDLPDDAAGVGLHLLQARRELLGRDARRPISRSEGHAHRSLPARHAGGAARARATASSSAATIRSGRRSDLIHGSRSSNDIKRALAHDLAHVARQNLSRNWQNGRLWWNDPDAVVLTGELPTTSFSSTRRRSSHRAA